MIDVRVTHAANGFLGRFAHQYFVTKCTTTTAMTIFGPWSMSHSIQPAQRLTSSIRSLESNRSRSKMLFMFVSSFVACYHRITGGELDSSVALICLLQ